MKIKFVVPLILLGFLTACGGGGGSGSSSSSSGGTTPEQSTPVVTPTVTPIAVQASSYDNKNNILLDDPKIPTIWAMPDITLETGEGGFNGRAIAFADFQQNGTAISSLKCNTGLQIHDFSGEHFRWRFKCETFSGPVVELSGNGIEIALRKWRQI